MPENDPQMKQWLTELLDAADTGPWRKRAQQALKTSDWKALERIVEEALAARQPPSALLRLAREIPWDSPIRLKLFRRIRQAYPGDFWANHELACYLHYSQSPYLEEALRYYTAALALRPRNPGTCVNLGNALRNSGDLDGAIAAYREALDGHRDYAMARVQLSLLLEAKGDASGAIAELREALRLTNCADGHLRLGNALFRSGRRDEAIASYKTAIALDPKRGMAHYNLGTALLEKKECLQEAIASFQNALACYRSGGSPNSVAWFLATCPYVPLRDPVEGLKQAKKAVELAPGTADCWNTLGVAQYRAGNWKEAIAALEKVMALRGGDSFDWFFLAMAHWQLGEKKKARQYFDRAVEWMDKNMPTRKELGRFRAEAAELINVAPKKN